MSQMGLKCRLEIVREVIDDVARKWLFLCNSFVPHRIEIVYNSILKFVFCHASTLLQSHNSTISYFHNFTISQFITVVKIEPIDIDIYFHRLENAKAGLSPGLAPPQQCLGGWLERIVPNICVGRTGVRRRNTANAFKADPSPSGLLDRFLMRWKCFSSQQPAVSSQSERSWRV